MMRIGSLFSGVDGLALGVQMRTLARVAWHAEIDPDGARVLAAHWRAPNLGDLTTVNWDAVEPVDIMVGGFPCTDLSLAGKGAGIDGPKSGLWREYVRAIRALRPSLVFVENVSALLARGFERVASDLAESGYRFAWSSYSSGAVGAPHRRERMFILAASDAAFAGLEGAYEHRAEHTHDARRGLVADAYSERLRDAEQRHARWGHGVRDEGGAELVDDGEAIDADTDGQRYERLTSFDGENGGLDEQSGHDADGCSADGRLGGGVGHDTGAIPGGVPTVGKHGRTRTAATRHLNPDFVEWMMGFPPGWTAMVPRRARLRLLGNSVQPQTAMAAWDGLMARLGAAA